MSIKIEGTPVPLESLREELFSLYSDLFKDEYGVRPRFGADYSIAELERHIERLAEAEPEQPTSGEGWAFTPAQ